MSGLPVSFATSENHCLNVIVFRVLSLTIYDLVTTGGNAPHGPRPGGGIGFLSPPHTNIQNFQKKNLEKKIKFFLILLHISNIFITFAPLEHNKY
nr:MAG TPA: hypothetical protein [Bacteriophage sp.]